jgi:hypothetical protein
MTRIWTQEQRERLAALIRHAKPWLKSTGPKTVQGKIIAARNSMKHGLYSKAATEFNAIMRRHARFLASIRALLAAKKLSGNELVSWYAPPPAFHPHLRVSRESQIMLR